MRTRDEEHTSSRQTQTSFAQRVLGAVDLAIDFATLGEYGLEPLPADGPRRERPGRRSGREALAASRPQVCDSRARRRRRRQWIRLRDLV